MFEANSRLRRSIRVACLVFGAVAATVAIGECVQQWRETRELRAQLDAWNLPADPRGKALAIRDHVRSAAGHAGLRVSDPRPFLRATATETLRSGKGFCGEASRVIIRMLELEGIEARRLYLWGGELNQHVAVEAIVDGSPMVLESLAEGSGETELAAYLR